jgi:hypothetical protein
MKQAARVEAPRVAKEQKTAVRKAKKKLAGVMSRVAGPECSSRARAVTRPAVRRDQQRTGLSLM